MGLLGDLIGGALGLAADVTGAVIQEGVIAHNEKKLQQELEKNEPMLADFINSCTVTGQETAIEAKHELYKNELDDVINQIIELLLSGKALHSYVQILVQQNTLDVMQKYVDNIYESIFMLNEKYATDDVMRSTFKSAKTALVQRLKDEITSLLSMPDGITEGFYRCENFMLIIGFLLLLSTITGDTNFRLTAESIHDYQTNCTSVFTTLTPYEHGEFEIDNPDNVSIENVIRKIEEAEAHFTDNETGYYEGIRNYLNEDFLMYLGLRMWYYAELDPFDQNEFDKAGDCHNRYKTLSGNDLERVLAEIYVKNKLGGEMLVMQNIDEIMENASVRNPVYARALCSFLAWIECYQVELEVLKKAVQEKIQLTPDMLERLEFLAKGGAANKIKLYDIDDSEDCFYFDASTENIDNNGINALFAALQKKRRTLNYSLCISKWTKTVPLPRDMTFSPESLDAAFHELMDDFDNEIEYSRRNATAINLTNLTYQNCALFSFRSERCRGITILFDCEKFGRNLNVSILTLFTPDESMGTDMPRYACAVSGNRYTESFRESLLQALDSSFEKKSSIYGDISTSSTIFE